MRARFCRLGLKYKVLIKEGIKFEDEEITNLAIEIELNIFNLKTNKEIIFPTNNEKETIFVLKYIDNFIYNGNDTGYDIPKNLFVTDYISAEIVNGIFKENMKNRELEKYGYKIDFKIKDYYLSYVTGETMVGNYKAILTDSKKINRDIFNKILAKSDYFKSQSLLLDKVTNINVEF